jgi:hypothetical protein
MRRRMSKDGVCITANRDSMRRRMSKDGVCITANRDSMRRHREIFLLNCEKF